MHLLEHGAGINALTQESNDESVSHWRRIHVIEISSLNSVRDIIETLVQLSKKTVQHGQASSKNRARWLS